ncbi:glycosyltransferase family 39 protein [Sphingomonas sp. 1P06PA]|uniref:ArnT family glycosyltransferase n=1 Tax=Sphingomonas sp. 1P06PA TaxID=554121 RepID=UPI0039A47E4F
MARLRMDRWAWLLLAIIGLALCLRLATIGFGLPAMNDPDELMFELGALRMLRGPTLNPGWFGHPATTTMYVLAVVDALVFLFAFLTGQTASPTQFGGMVYADPSWIIVPGRIVMVLFALGTIWLTHALARRFFGQRAALVAALLLALNPVHITWSQIIRSDMMACLFMLLCLRSATAIATEGRWRDYMLAAVWVGLAIATKWPFALSAIAIVAATAVAARAGVLPLTTAIRRLVAAGAAAIATLCLTSPYLLIDYPTVMKNLRGEGQIHHLGSTGGSFVQNLLWYLDGPFLAGYGIAGLALIVVGALQLHRNRVALAILAPVALAFLLLFCAQQLVWERWALPLMPIGAIVAAWGLMRLLAFARMLDRPAIARFAPLVLLLAVTLPLGARVWADGRARMNDTRQQASAWAWRHIPPGSRILIEHNAFDMVVDRWHLWFPMGNAGCVDVVALIHGKASYSVIEQARGARANVDFGTMAADRRAECRPDFAVLTQFDRYRLERDRFPAEFRAYMSLVARGSIAATFGPVPGRIGGPIVRILDLRPGARQARRNRH